MQHSKPVTFPWTKEEQETAHLSLLQWMGAHHPHHFCLYRWLFLQTWPRPEAFTKCWGIAMLGAWVNRPNGNVWSFLYPVCSSEQDLCSVQRCQMCLGSHKQLQNSAHAYTWVQACTQTDKPEHGIQERLVINRQHWHTWWHWRAVPHEGPILPRKQNIFSSERTDWVLTQWYEIPLTKCLHRGERSSGRTASLGLQLEKKIFFETSEEEDPSNYKTFSLPSVLGRIMEQVFTQIISLHMKGNTATAKNQHGLTNGKLINNLDNGT